MKANSPIQKLTKKKVNRFLNDETVTTIRTQGEYSFFLKYDGKKIFGYAENSVEKILIDLEANQ